MAPTRRIVFYGDALSLAVIDHGLRDWEGTVTLTVGPDDFAQYRLQARGGASATLAALAAGSIVVTTRDYLKSALESMTEAPDTPLLLVDSERHRLTRVNLRHHTVNTLLELTQVLDNIERARSDRDASKE